MQNKFKLSVKAREDVKNIFRYSLQRFGENQTMKYKADLGECFQLLADNPNMGRECNDIRDGYFRHEHQSHIIFYIQKSKHIFITTIIHNRVDIKNMFGERRET